MVNCVVNKNQFEGGSMGKKALFYSREYYVVSDEQRLLIDQINYSVEITSNEPVVELCNILELEYKLMIEFLPDDETSLLLELSPDLKNAIQNFYSNWKEKCIKDKERVRVTVEDLGIRKAVPHLFLLASMLNQHFVVVVCSLMHASS